MCLVRLLSWALSMFGELPRWALVLFGRCCLSTCVPGEAVTCAGLLAQRVCFLRVSLLACPSASIAHVVVLQWVQHALVLQWARQWEHAWAALYDYEAALYERKGLWAALYEAVLCESGLWAALYERDGLSVRSGAR